MTGALIGEATLILGADMAPLDAELLKAEKRIAESTAVMAKMLELNMDLAGVDGVLAGIAAVGGAVDDLEDRIVESSAVEEAAVKRVTDAYLAQAVAAKLAGDAGDEAAAKAAGVDLAAGAAGKGEQGGSSTSIWGVRGGEHPGSVQNPPVVLIAGADKYPLGPMAAAVADQSVGEGPKVEKSGEGNDFFDLAALSAAANKLSEASKVTPQPTRVTVAGFESKAKEDTGVILPGGGKQTSSKPIPVALTGPGGEQQRSSGLIVPAGAKTEPVPVVVEGSKEAVPADLLMRELGFSSAAEAEKGGASADIIAALKAKELAPGQRASNRPGYLAAYEALGYTVGERGGTSRLYGVGGEPGTSKYGLTSEAIEVAAADEASKATSSGSGSTFWGDLLPALLWGHGGSGGGHGYSGAGGGIFWHALMGAGGLGAGIGSLGSFAGFGAEHIVLTLGGIAGSGVSALGGGSLLAGGALAKMGVGVGSDMGVSSSAVADTESLYKAYEALQKAVYEYGKSSKEAKEAQQELNVVMNYELEDTKGVKAELKLAEGLYKINKEWDRESSGGRVQFAQLAESALPVAKTYIPIINESAEQNFAATKKALKPLLAWIQGPEVIGLFQKLETEFFAEIPTGTHALTEGLKFFAKSIEYLSPLTGGLITDLNDFFTKMNESGHFAKWEHMMGDMIEDFHVWGKFFKEFGDLFVDIFSKDAKTGEGVIETLTEMMHKAKEWVESTTGTEDLKTIFTVHKAEVEELLKALIPLIDAYREVYMTVAPPLVKAVTGIVKVFTSLLTAFEKLGSGADWVIGLALLAKKFGVLGTAINGVGVSMGLMNPKLSEAAKLSNAQVAATDRQTAATERLAGVQTDTAVPAADADAAAQAKVTGSLGAEGAAAGAGVAGGATEAAGAEEATGGSGILDLASGAMLGKLGPALKEGGALSLEDVVPAALLGTIGAVGGNMLAKATGAKGEADTSLTLAGAGAGVGFSLGGPLGAILGAGIFAASPVVIKAMGDLFEEVFSSKFSPGVEHKIRAKAKQLAPGIEGEPEKETHAHRAELVGLQRELHQARNEVREAQQRTSIAPGPGGQEGRLRSPERNRNESEAALAKEAAAYAKWGAKAGEVFTKEYERVKFKGPLDFEINMENRLSEMPPKARRAAAETMLAYAGELEARGILPKNAVEKMLGQVEQQFPALSSFLKQFGVDLDQKAAVAFKLTEAEKALDGTLTSVESMLGFTSHNITKGFARTMGDLEQILAAKRGPMSKEAATLMATLDEEMGAKERSLKKQWKETWRELSENPTAMNRKQLEKQVELFEESGIITVEKGNEALLKQTDAALKKLGYAGMEPTSAAEQKEGHYGLKSKQPSKGLGVPFKEYAGGGQVQWGSPGDSGHDTIPVNFGGIPIKVGAGERGVVLNKSQAPMVDTALAYTYGLDGLSGLFDAVKTPNYMASGGIIAPKVSGTGGIAELVRGSLKDVAEAAGKYLHGKEGSRKGAPGSYPHGTQGAGGLSRTQLEALWVEAGGSEASMAATVALVESGGRSIMNEEGSSAAGPWQVLGGSLNPLQNAREAVALWRERGWQPWEAGGFASGGFVQGFAKGGLASRNATAAAGSSVGASASELKAAKAQRGARSPKMTAKAERLSLASFLGHEPAVSSIEQRSATLQAMVEENAPMLSEKAEKVQAELEAYVAKDSTGEEWVIRENSLGEKVPPYINMAGVEGNLSFLHKLEGLGGEELSELLSGWGLSGGMQSNIEGMIASWKRKLEEEKSKLKQLREELKAQVANLHEELKAQEQVLTRQINENDARIKTLTKERERLEKDKESVEKGGLPSIPTVSTTTKGKKYAEEEAARNSAEKNREKAEANRKSAEHGYEHEAQEREHQIKVLERANEKLGGDPTEVGEGGELKKTINAFDKRIKSTEHSYKSKIKAVAGNDKKLETGSTALGEALTSVKGDRTSLGGMLGVATGEYGPQSLIGSEQTTLGKLNQEVEALGSGPEQPLGVALAKAMREYSEESHETEDEKELNELLKQQLEQKSQTIALSEAAQRTFTEMYASGELPTLPPFGGSFATGGIVPGPRGQARTAILHGEEQVLSVAQREGKEGATVQLIVHPNAGVDESKLEVVANGVQQRGNRSMARRVSRQLPSRGGGVR